MILRRLGNKQNIAKQIIKYFLPHECYIEPFFGAGGLFFKKDKAKYNILNDLDDDVFNLFFVLKNNFNELKKEIEDLIVHKSLFEYFKINKFEDKIKKALRFVYLSNFSFLGTMNTFTIKVDNTKKIILDRLNYVYDFIKDNCLFTCLDFRDFLDNLSFRNQKQDKKRCFIYCDPPYVNTSNNYCVDRFTINDFEDLIKKLIELNINFIINEFYNEKIISILKRYNLYFIELREKFFLGGSKKVEILISNYPLENNLWGIIYE